MLKFIFKPLKWFVNCKFVTKALLLITIGLLGYGSFLVAEYFCGIQITSLSVQLLREGFGLLASICAIILFVIGMATEWKYRKDCWDWDYGYQIGCFIVASTGLGFPLLVIISKSIAQTFFGINIPFTEALWCSCVPSALFLLIATFTFSVKFGKKTWKAVSEHVADAWRNA